MLCLVLFNYVTYVSIISFGPWAMAGLMCRITSVGLSIYFVSRFISMTNDQPFSSGNLCLDVPLALVAILIVLNSYQIILQILCVN
jgi:hypothetical protein